MIIRYTRPAARQLTAVLDYIADYSPQGAGHVFDRIEETLDLIATHPGIGRGPTDPDSGA